MRNLKGAATAKMGVGGRLSYLLLYMFRPDSRELPNEEPPNHWKIPKYNPIRFTDLKEFLLSFRFVN